MEKGLAAGGREPMPMMDYGFLQVRTIEDLKGHTWALFYMDPPKGLWKVDSWDQGPWGR